MIVDDEANARSILQEMIERDDSLRIVGSYGDPEAALEAILQDPPDLLFLDIEMPRLNGFQLLAAVDGNLPAVIFTTAYDSHAIRAFEVCATDYLLKPFLEDRFTQAVTRSRGVIEAQDVAGRSNFGPRDAETIQRILSGLREEASPFALRLPVQSGQRIRLLPVEELDTIEADGSYVNLSAGRQTFQLRESLASLERRLDPGMFARVHRRYIVNVGSVIELEPLSKGEYALLLRDGRRIVTGRTYRDQVRDIFRLTG